MVFERETLHPGTDLVAVLAPAPRFAASFVPLAVTVPHVAIGIWVGTACVLFLPGRRDEPVDEDRFLRAWGICTSVFGLL